jgi:hypothetical protein
MSPNTPANEVTAEIQSQPNNLISIPTTSSKNKGTIDGHPIEKLKQEKDKNILSITLVPQASQESSKESSMTHPLLTLYPMSRTTAVEWRDALQFLVGLPAGQETEEFTKCLADVGVRVKLLDIVAGGVDIPRTKPIIEGVSMTPGTAGRVSITGEFWYDSMVD